MIRQKIQIGKVIVKMILHVPFAPYLRSFPFFFKFHMYDTSTHELTDQINNKKEQENEDSYLQMLLVQM